VTDLITRRFGLWPEVHWHVDVLGLSVGGRALYLAVLAAALLGITAPLALGKAGEIRTRWTTWALILPVIGIPIWTGRPATTLLATLLALGAVVEYSRLARLHRSDTVWLICTALLLPLGTLSSRTGDVGNPGAWVPWIILGGAAIPLLGSDTADGFRRATITAFGIVWLCWSLANLPLLGRDAFVVLFAAACADVGAFVAGTTLRRYPWAARKLTPLSPNKTWGGVIGAFATAAGILLLCGALSVGWLLAIGVGGVAGDLLESMLKRQVGVKDAGAWLPGFGGLLDRIDSLLIAVPLAVLLS
jgi:phosphatidate cytidylyltransferase